MARQNVDYGYAIQKLYIEMMLTDSTTFVRCQSIFDYTLFDQKLQQTAKFIFDYVKEHSILPTFEIVNASCSQKLENPGTFQAEHYDWLLLEFETFIKHKSLERAIIDSSDLLETGNYGPVEDLIKKAVQISLTKDLGTNYFENPKNRLLELKDKNGQISTGWPSLDHLLYGGMNRGELNLFTAGSGGGKSLFLANLGLNWVENGLNTLYITLELNEKLVSLRLDSMNTGMSTRDIFKNIDTVDMKIRMMQKKAGKFQIKYIPSGKNVNDIRAYIKEYELKMGCKVDVLLVDYLDLLMPLDGKIKQSDLFVKDKYISEELRNLAMEKNCIMVSASQINRSGVNEVEFDHSHISGGLSKIQTADNVFGIYTSKSLREQGKYHLQLMKTRSSSGVGKKIELDFDVDSLRITDNGEGEEYVIETKGTQILNDIQRKGVVTVEAPKVKADVETAALRDLLNKMKTANEP